MEEMLAYGWMIGIPQVTLQEPREEEIWNLERALEAKVATIMDGNTWRWPRQRNRVTSYIISHAHVFLVSNPSCSDRVIWLPASDGK